MFVTGAALSLGLHNAQLRSQAHEAFSLTPPFMVGVQIFLCWMLYLYTALALRENVLKVCKRILEACFADGSSSAVCLLSFVVHCIISQPSDCVVSKRVVMRCICVQLPSPFWTSIQHAHASQ